MKQKLNKKIIIPAVLIGGGAALYFLNKSGKLDKLKDLIGTTKTPEEKTPEEKTQKEISTPEPPKPPAPPKIGLAYKVGDKVIAIRRARTYPGYTLVNEYTAGATTGNGYYEPGNYVGIVKEVIGRSVKITRYSAPYPEIKNTFSANTKIFDFFVLNIMIEKSLT